MLLFDDMVLQKQVRKLFEADLRRVWHLTRCRLEAGICEAAVPASAIYVHKRLSAGLPRESWLVASAMFLNDLPEAQAFFDLSFTMINSRVSGRLDTAESERAMRGARASMTAAEALGSFDAAREYMRTRNFVLGGATPAELIKTAVGERIVIDELCAQAEGAPL